MREITQADVDAALQEWNGDMDSKRRVQRYMTDHSREKGTADWLRGEYGDDLPAFPVTAEGAAIDLPWSKVQRHFARLVKEDRFFTEQELDNFEDIDPAAIREQLEQHQDTPTPFVEQVKADVGQIAAEEQAQKTPLPEATAPPARAPLAPTYGVEDTVYLEDTAYRITDVNLFDVQLQDPTLAYPILRSEPKERFERLLWQDERNAHLFTQKPEQARPAPEQAIAKSARPSVLDSLKRPLPPREKNDKPKPRQPER